MKKKFKIIFVAAANSYGVWFTDHTGEYDASTIYYTFKKDGTPIEGATDETALISENIIWEINKLIGLGYKFEGVERK